MYIPSYPHSFCLNGQSPLQTLTNQQFIIQSHQYTLIKKINSGSFGTVYAAVNEDGRRAAVKVFNIGGCTSTVEPLELQHSILKEIKIAYKMRRDHENVVTIYGFDFNPHLGIAMIAMELGMDNLTTLAQRYHSLKQQRRNIRATFGADYRKSGDYIGSIERKIIWKELVKILEGLFRHNIIHRDLKPDNIVQFENPSIPLDLKIVDLGIAQNAYERQIGTPMGTQYYSAPECLEIYHITFKADIWSAGAILYFITYGI
ncbi:unnamed protein product, partial [Didymodactylos carnosus]